MSNSVRPHRRQPTRLPHPWDSPGKNTGVGCHFLLQCVKVKSLSRVRLFATPWMAAYQAPPPMGFSRQEHWSGVPLPQNSTTYNLKIVWHISLPILFTFSWQYPFWIPLSHFKSTDRSTSFLGLLQRDLSSPSC